MHFFLEEGGEQKGVSDDQLECNLFYGSLRAILQLEGQNDFDLKAH